MTTAPRTCPNCHAEVSADARFCPNCGYGLSSGGAAAGADAPELGQGGQSGPPESAVRPISSQPASGPQTSDERTWAALTHLAAFAVVVFPLFGNIIGPLVLWLIKKQESSFIDEHGKAALNFQISTSIYFLVSAILVFVLVGFLLLPLLGIFWLVMTIVAAVRASNGQDPGYMLSIRFIS